MDAPDATSHHPQQPARPERILVPRTYARPRAPDRRRGVPPGVACSRQARPSVVRWQRARRQHRRSLEAARPRRTAHRLDRQPRSRIPSRVFARPRLLQRLGIRALRRRRARRTRSLRRASRAASGSRATQPAHPHDVHGACTSAGSSGRRRRRATPPSSDSRRAVRPPAIVGRMATPRHLPPRWGARSTRPITSASASASRAAQFARGAATRSAMRLRARGAIQSSAVAVARRRRHRAREATRRRLGEDPACRRRGRRSAPRALRRAFLRDSIESRVRECPAPAYIAASPGGALAEFRALAPDAAASLNPTAPFGARLQHAFETALAAGARRPVLIGTDSPTLPVTPPRRRSPRACDARRRARPGG